MCLLLVMGGVPGLGGVYSGGVYSWGVSALGGEVSGLGGCTWSSGVVYLVLGGCLLPGGVASQHAVRQTPPCEQNDRQVQKYYLGHSVSW